jgi:hypothetical protein
MATYNESVSGVLTPSGVSKTVSKVVEPLLPPRSQDWQEIRRFMEEVCKNFSYIRGVGTPLGHITPRWANDRYLDTSGSDWYVSTGTTASTWLKVTP